MREPGTDPGFAKGGGSWRARGARAYNGDLAQSPQRGPGAVRLVGGQVGEAP